MTGTRCFLFLGFTPFSLWEGAMINSTSLPLNSPPAPTTQAESFLLTGTSTHQVGQSQGLSMFSLGCGSYLLQVLPRVGPELCLQDPP